MINAPAKLSVSRPTVRVRWFSMTIVLTFCAALSALRWLKLDRLWGDSDRWMFEVYRTANHEIPYLDFAWQYPPLAIYLGALFLIVFGMKFAALQIYVDTLSTLLVLLTMSTARRFLSTEVAVAVAILTACVGASNTGNFALFSLQIYTPALLIGLIGLLLLVREYADYLESGVWTRSRICWAALGAGIALLSKPEFIVGSIGVILAGAFAGRGRWYASWPGYLRSHGWILLSLFAPAAVIYGIVAGTSGFGNMLEGIGGYGIARLTCPWWPTGLGMFGALSALCYGLLLAGGLSFLRFRSAWKRHGARYGFLLAAAAISIVVLWLYLPFAAADSPVLQGAISPLRIASFAFSIGSLLLPVMWIGVLICLWLAFVYVFRGGRGLPLASYQAALLLFPAVLISLRGIFGGTMSQLTSVSAAAYPLWLICAAYLLLRFFKWLEPESTGELRRMTMVNIILMGYAVVRLAGAVNMEMRSPYTALQTAAGVIRIQEAGTSADVYHFITANSKPGESILDVANGGGVNFAAHRSSPIFSTQFTALAPSLRYLAEDLERIRRMPPQLVIANAGPDFQASYGLCLNTGCTCPSFVWSSNRLACDPNRKFPVLEYIRARYEPNQVFGEKVIYVKKEGFSDER